MAVVLGDNLQPVDELAFEAEGLKFAQVALAALGHDINVNLVDELDAVFAVGVVLLEKGLEEGVALLVEIGDGDGLVASEKACHDFLVGVLADVHVYVVEGGRRYDRRHRGLWL